VSTAFFTRTKGYVKHEHLGVLKPFIHFRVIVLARIQYGRSYVTLSCQMGEYIAVMLSRSSIQRQGFQGTKVPVSYKGK
jgi:hypothetical protein